MSGHGVRGAFVLCAVLLAGAAAWAWVPLGSPVPGAFSDSVDYLVYADFFRGAFQGAWAPYEQHYFGETRYPPLFPLLLAATGSGTDGWANAYWLDFVLCVAALALATAWYLRETGSTAAACVLGLLLASNPNLFLIQQDILSEPLFLAILLGAVLASRAMEDDPRRCIALFALVAIAPLARVAGVALVLACVPWVLRDPRLRTRRVALCLALASLPGLAWIGYRMGFRQVEGYLDSLGSGAMLDGAGGVMGAALDAPRRLFEAFVANFSVAPTALVRAAMAFLAVLAAIGWLRRLRANRLDAWLLPAYLGLVAVWPYPAETARLLLVAVPVLLLAAWEGAVAGVARLRLRPALAMPLVAVLVTMASAGTWSRFAARVAGDLPAELRPYARNTTYLSVPDDAIAAIAPEFVLRLYNLARSLPDTVPGHACVYAVQSAAVWLHSGRRVRVKPMPLRLDPARPAGDQFEECEFFVVASPSSPQFGQPALYPAAILGDELKPILLSETLFRGRTVVAAGLLQRVRPAAAPTPVYR